MSKHTPGPWRIVWYDAGDTPWRDMNGPCPSVEAPDHIDCAVVHWDGFKQEYWTSANGDQRQIEANARLIAAAPDMLDALRDAERAVDELCIGQSPENECCLILGRIRAAIAKAETE